MLKSEKKIFDFLNRSARYRRYNFTGAGNYFDFIFLCGKKLAPGDNRSFIMKEMDRLHLFSLLSEQLYAEFKDLNYDLLTIEEILLSICSSTILIVESFGSACELGAFSFSNSNLEKLRVINNKMFDGDGSFITDGPIKKIENKYPYHVIYQEFDKNGNIVFDKEAYNMFLGAKSNGGFSTNPIEIDASSMICTIRDLRFVISLLFDYVRLFGVLLENNILLTLKALYPAKEYRIKFQSGNSLDPDETKLVLGKMLIVLSKSNLLLRKTLKGIVYYTLNYDTFLRIGIKPTDFSSFIFTSGFFNLTNKKDIYKILNTEKQEGFLLWKES